VSVEVDVDTTFDTDVKEEEEEIDLKFSFEKRLENSVKVSCTLLDKLGLEQYIPTVQKNNVAIEALLNLGYEGLTDVGIKDPVHRAQIIAAGAHDFIRAPPPKVDGKPVEVRLKMGFARLARINTVDLTCDIKLFVDLYWNDPSMIGMDPDNVPPYVWRPNAYIYNSIDKTGENGGKVNEHGVSLMDSKTGLLLHALELEVTISNEMDLRRFPFDADAVEILVLQDETENADDWVLRPHENMENAIQFFYNVFETTEWSVNGFSMDFFENIGGNGVKYTHCNAMIHIQRRPLFYMWKLVLPLFLTTAFAFGSFFFTTDELEARANAAATTLLTTVALIYVLSNELPKTNYQTLIDWFLVFCLVVQVAVWLISNILVFVPEDEAKDIDRMAAIILAAAFSFVTLALFVPRLYFWSISSKFSPPTAYPVVGRYGNKLDYYVFKENLNVWY